MGHTKQSDYTFFILPLLTTLAVWLFFGFFYPHHLHYQEQFQLFLFDSDYAWEVIRWPGGLSDYIGRFLTQFFLFAKVGAAFLGVLIASILLLTARQLGKGWLSCLSVLPPLLAVSLLCDENALEGGIVAILIAQLSALCISVIDNPRLRHLIAIACTPLFYWAMGPLGIVAVVLIAINELRMEVRKGTIGYIIILLVLSLTLPALLESFVAVEPQYMYSGIHYMRSHGADASCLWYLALSVAALPVFALIWKKGMAPVSPWKSLVLSLVLAVGGCFALVKPSVNMKAEHVMAYDFMARMKQWNRIQQTAISTPPNNALSTTVLNLALAQSGRLGEQMFEYQQKGTAGLLPPFESDAMSPLATSEVYYHLGMINTAQRYSFEAQEAILDYQKSARCYKRLAETNMINGNYPVARKYLVTLQKTLFYSDWADQTLGLLGNEEAIDNHPEYGLLRRNCISYDSFYNENNYIGMLQQLYLSNKSNRLGFEYLLAACLLKKDLDMFVEVLGMNDAIAFETIPTYFQQALALWWSINKSNSEQTPPGVGQ
ncbi:MAG: DUF6057 family protein, partial [Prevotellaceae bacterium]|nr:DUF6057 family protein [Prevotellaceae bacterium]